MAINNTPKTGIGSVLGIGTAAISGTPGQTEFEAETYAVPSELGSFQEPGTSFDEQTWTRINDGRILRSKGAKDYGNITATIAFLPTDAARDAFDAALDDTAGQYPFRIEHTADGTTTSGFVYFVGRVMAAAPIDINNDAMRTVQYTIAVLQQPIYVAAT